MALILAVVGLFIPVLLPVAALFMALVASRRIKRSGGALRGKGIAVGAGITAGVVLLLNAITIFAIVANWSEIQRGFGTFGEAVDAGRGLAEGTVVEWHAVESGACFRQAAFEYSLLEPVACETPHHGEVFRTFPLAGDAYPGENALAATVERECQGDYEAFVGGSDNPPDWAFLAPDRVEWGNGVRQAVCMVVPAEGAETLTGSARGGG
jgi:hypothetical protein